MFPLRHFLFGGLCAMILYVLLDVQHGRETFTRARQLLNGAESTVTDPESTTSIPPPLPPFVDTNGMAKAHAITSLGYECFESLPRIFERAPVEIRVQFGARVEEIKSFGAVICKAQKKLYRDILDIVNTLWNICFSPPPCRGEGFSYGLFDRQVFNRATSAGQIDPLSRNTSNFRRDFVDLAKNLTDLHATVIENMRASNPSIEGQVFVRDFTVVASTASLVSSTFDIFLDVLEYHLFQLGSETGLDDRQVVHLIEAIYEEGLWFLLRAEIMEQYC